MSVRASLKEVSKMLLIRVIKGDKSVPLARANVWHASCCVSGRRVHLRGRNRGGIISTSRMCICGYTYMCVYVWFRIFVQRHSDILELHQRRNWKSFDYGLRLASRSVKVRSIKIDGPVQEGTNRRFLIIGIVPFRSPIRVEISDLTTHIPRKRRLSHFFTYTEQRYLRNREYQVRSRCLHFLYFYTQYPLNLFRKKSSLNLSRLAHTFS